MARWRGDERSVEGDDLSGSSLCAIPYILHTFVDTNTLTYAQCMYAECIRGTPECVCVCLLQKYHCRQVCVCMSLSLSFSLYVHVYATSACTCKHHCACRRSVGEKYWYALFPHPAALSQQKGSLPHLNDEYTSASVTRHLQPPLSASFDVGRARRATSTRKEASSLERTGQNIL